MSSFCANIFAPKNFKAKLRLEKSCPKYFCTKKVTHKTLMNLNTGVNFTNPFLQSAITLDYIVWPKRCNSVSPTKLHPSFRLLEYVHNWKLHLTFILYAMYLKDQSKSTGTKAVHKMMRKSIPRDNPMKELCSQSLQITCRIGLVISACM